MSAKEQLTALRREIDRIDHEMVKLFDERMQVSEQVAKVKAAGNISIVDESREQQVLNAAMACVSAENTAEVVIFMRALMALSKIRQNKKLMRSEPVVFPESMRIEKENVTVAFQGVSGAWGENGAMRLFPRAGLMQCEYFDNVFDAVKTGRADYGVLPIENSQTGAIGEVYDLLRRHSCYIVGQVWVPVAHCLLGTEGTALHDIHEVFSHPEGFNQCRKFLKNRNWDLTVCRNTAYAAQMVAEKRSNRYAAIGSRRAAEVHGLSVLVPDIVDNPHNQTRFIAIAAQPVYDDTSDIVSITFSTAHKSGALCAVLECFMVAGINLSRIESRPAAAEKYRFFADLQANILSSATLDALAQAAVQCDYFEVLGCYKTTVQG